MKFSTVYLIYPENRAMERSIAGTVSLFDEEMAAAGEPDTRIAVADNFLFTRGNFEPHRFSSKIFENMSEALEAALAGAPDADIDRTREPAIWADTQNKLGNILAAMGQQRWDEALFERAIHCFEKALEVYSQESTPQEWAITQFNLATANQALGGLQESARPFKDAIDAYTNALMVWTKEAATESWMLTMHQLGNTLHAHGKLLKGNRQFQKSVVAYKNALSVLDADNYALELTATHNNRAVVLHHEAESEDNPERLEEAIRSYEKALTVSMEQQLPIHLAVLCRVNKATAQLALAELTKNIGLAEEMVDEFEVIIECFSHALQPLCLRHCQEQMKKAKTMTLVSSES